MKKIIRVCCVCQKFERDGEWVKGEFPEGHLSHGYCPECFAVEMESIREWQSAKKS